MHLRANLDSDGGCSSLRVRRSLFRNLRNQSNERSSCAPAVVFTMGVNFEWRSEVQGPLALQFDLTLFQELSPLLGNSKISIGPPIAYFNAALSRAYWTAAASSMTPGSSFDNARCSIMAS